MRATMQTVRPWVLGTAVLGMACRGAELDSHDPDADAGTGTTSSTTPSTTGSSSFTGDAGVTTGTLDGTTSTDATGVGFIPPEEPNPAIECDLEDQDCPPGEKCTPWANDRGDVWNATRCVPVAGDPAGAGEPCHVEGWPTSGLDDCEPRAMCLYVDPDTLEGLCMPLCQVDDGNVSCEDPERVCPIHEGQLLVCILRCDPLAQDCPRAQGCYPLDDEWQCVADASGDTGAYGDACSASVRTCDPELVCVSASAMPPGLPCERAAGCCTELCDLADPLGDQQCPGAAAGQTCQAWYPKGTAPPGLEHVGACALPP